MEVRPATLIPTWQVRKLRLGHRLGRCGPRLRQGLGGPWVTGTLSMTLSSASTARGRRAKTRVHVSELPELTGNHFFEPSFLS